MLPGIITVLEHRVFFLNHPSQNWTLYAGGAQLILGLPGSGEDCGEGESRRKTEDPHLLRDLQQRSSPRGQSGSGGFLSTGAEDPERGGEEETADGPSGEYIDVQ